MPQHGSCSISKALGTVASDGVAVVEMTMLASFNSIWQWSSEHWFSPFESSRYLKLGLGRVGFHTFRHTYFMWLDETGGSVGVQQKLMRHAPVSTTMDQYGNASALAKRKANRPIVLRLVRRSANQEVSIQ
jgi:integrase